MTHHQRFKRNIKQTKLKRASEEGLLVDCKPVWPLQKTIWWLLEKLQIELPHDPVIPLVGIYPKEMTSLRDISTTTFIINNHQGMETILSVHWQKNEQRKCGIYINILGYYSPLKNKEILSFETTWINPEGIMFSKISQTEKDRYCMGSLVWSPVKNKVWGFDV